MPAPATQQQITSKMLFKLVVAYWAHIRSMHQGARSTPWRTNAHKHTAHILRANVLEWNWVDTEAGMLSGISQKRSIRSSPYWFTEFCNSQCLSHFAAPFIVVRAETSVAESCRTNSITEYERMVSKYPTAGRKRITLPIPPCCPRVSQPGHWCYLFPSLRNSQWMVHNGLNGYVRMILPQVHLRKPCYDFSFL